MAGFEFSFDVGEVRQLAERMESAAEDVSLSGRAVTNQYATLIAQDARRRVHVITGRLRASIQVTHAGGAAGGLGLAIADVEASAPYAGYEEFGTVHRPPHPYMRPAVEKYRQPFRRAMAQAGASHLTGGTFGKGSALRSAGFRSY